MDNLTPQDLFSPSKARQQRAQAADWAAIDSWLSQKYSGRSVPSFERNADTLKALRELSAANERIDEEKMVLGRVEREALRELEEVEEKKNPEDVRILEVLQSRLTDEGSEAIAALAGTATALQAPSTDPETLAHALIQHTSTAQTLTNNLAYIETLQSYLSEQHRILQSYLTALQSDPAFTTPPNLPRQTTEQVRQTKHLRAKIREYEDKLAGLQDRKAGATPGDRKVGSAEAIVEMLEQQGELDNLRQRVEGLEREVDEFAALPADREMARREVGKLEVELDQVRRRRDDLFGGLVGKLGSG